MNYRTSLICNKTYSPKCSLHCYHLDHHLWWKHIHVTPAPGGGVPFSARAWIHLSLLTCPTNGWGGAILKWRLPWCRGRGYPKSWRKEGRLRDCDSEKGRVGKNPPNKLYSERLQNIARKGRNGRPAPCRPFCPFFHIRATFWSRSE